MPSYNGSIVVTIKQKLKKIFVFSTICQNITIFKQLIYITCVNWFIEVQLYNMFRLVEPSSGNTLQHFLKFLYTHPVILPCKKIKLTKIAIFQILPHILSET
jgi:hypothetical protein